jgi:hypothetical protein
MANGAWRHLKPPRRRKTANGLDERRYIIPVNCVDFQPGSRHIDRAVVLNYAETASSANRETTARNYDTITYFPVGFQIESSAEYTLSNSSNHSIGSCRLIERKSKVWSNKALYLIVPWYMSTYVKVHNF